MVVGGGGAVKRVFLFVGHFSQIRQQAEIGSLIHIGIVLMVRRKICLLSARAPPPRFCACPSQQSR